MKSNQLAAIKRAIDILENDAEDLKWQGEIGDGLNEAEKQDIAERKQVAKVLRGLIEVK